HYLAEALFVGLSSRERINFTSEDFDILTGMGFGPVGVWSGKIKKKTPPPPAQSLIYARRRTELAGR
ncbi:phage polarity suppression protein, partial [Klebsiella quasipneumoniae]|uniref:phage polarity suppression protein n=1 Tax=Klebsiella quasipneumoniae TaxID=1463165 RepID=UPI0032F006C3